MTVEEEKEVIKHLWIKTEIAGNRGLVPLLLIYVSMGSRALRMIQVVFYHL